MSCSYQVGITTVFSPTPIRVKLDMSKDGSAHALMTQSPYWTVGRKREPSPILWCNSMRCEGSIPKEQESVWVELDSPH